VKRPVSVVLLQIALVVFLFAALPFFFRGLYLNATTSLASDPGAAALRLLPGLLIVAFTVLVLWALWYRKPSGKWLGLACIVLMAAGVVHGWLNAPVQPEFETGETGFPIGRVIALVLLAWWFYAFGFTRKARAFFAVEQKQEQA